MAYFIPFPSARDEPTRTARIKKIAPQATAALKRIEESSEDLPFGSSISDVLNNYHFPSEAEVEAYFRIYLAEREGDVDDAMVDAYILDTINRGAPTIEPDKFANDCAFENIFKELHRQIETNSAENVPVVNFIIGATGAGKTAFSKSLFTVCRKRFWDERIVPSRVEYSKYYDAAAISPGASALELDHAFFSFVRRCQLRDLLIYFCSSGAYGDDEKRSIAARLALDGNAEGRLSTLLNDTRALVIDGETSLLDVRTRAIFDKAVQALADDRDRVLYKLSKELRVKFLVSFDGFDSTKIEHFLFEKSRNLPIYYLARMLKGLHEKSVVDGIGDHAPETHYLAYLRDTTFARLRTELFRSVGGSIRYPTYWIVPPAYRLLVQNAAVFLTGSRDSKENLSELFWSDIVQAFDRAVFDQMDLNAATHLAFVFGSSGRRMKYHIRHLLISALYRTSQSGEFNFERPASGIDAKSVWNELVSDHSVQYLPPYLILEDLFLNDSRQLIPKLELDPGEVTKLLDLKDFDSLLLHITDVDETCGIFGCLFNYFYRFSIGPARTSQPAMLILIRIIQYVERNPRCNADEIYDFLKAIGYNVSEEVAHFCLFVILRAELVKWDGSRGARTIRDVPLYITTTGRIAIEKLLFGITYMSEAFLSSIQTDRGLTNGLRKRVAENAVWIADCINNASIALLVIRKIEAIEREIAGSNGVDFADFVLYERLLDKLSKEASAITRAALRAADQATRLRWEENVGRLRVLRLSYPELVILGDSR